MRITRSPLFETGFRPFFLGASLHAVISMIIWLGVFTLKADIHLHNKLSMNWHAHEMIYGYAMAVIAGFLLTAVKNWTGLNTISGYRLLILFCLWLSARIFSFTGHLFSLKLAAVSDTIFTVFLIYGVAKPILKAGDRRQISIIAVLLLILVFNTVYYYGMVTNSYFMILSGIYTGLYLIIGLILILARRVIPFFTQRAVSSELSLRNFEFIDKLSPIFFVFFAVAYIYTDLKFITVLLAISLFIMHIVRLGCWYTHEIWRKPLLWILFVSYASIVSGFGMLVVSYIYKLPPFLFIHLFTVGGIGLMTIGMMSRVSLGHTGRNVYNNYPVLRWIFIPMILAVIFRVFMPLISEPHYILWIAVSQVLWIISFSIFFVFYCPILLSQRIDGKPG